MYEYAATLMGIVDGDTVHLRISLGMETYLNTTIRLYGINTPELTSHDAAERVKAVKAREFLRSRLPEDPNALTIRTYKDKREKYGRYLADIFVGQETTSVNAELLGLGLAVPYTP
jgi:micrococcal nuclease